jgi:ABC-type lipoprotein export system ATPase subunit
MSTPIAIVGPSGSGKSTSMESLDPKETFIINVASKPLPFKGWKSLYKPENKNYAKVISAPAILELITNISNKAPHIKVIVIDD